MHGISALHPYCVRPLFRSLHGVLPFGGLGACLHAPRPHEAPLVVESRGPSGEAQKSHWTTVVALACARPLKVNPGDTVGAPRWRRGRGEGEGVAIWEEAGPSSHGHRPTPYGRVLPRALCSIRLTPLTPLPSPRRSRIVSICVGPQVSVEATVDFSSSRVDVPVKYAFTGKLA
jgi:hypothetical protein